MTTATTTTPGVEAAQPWLPPTIVYIALAILSIAVYRLYKLVNAQRWSDYGVRSPPFGRFHFFGGEFREKVTTMLNQYGDTVGLKFGPLMALSTANLDLLKHILIKDFNNFTDRSGKFMSRTPVAKALFFAKGEEWKRHRQIISPTFTSGKLKHITKYVDDSAKDLASHIEEFAKSDATIPIRDVAGRYTAEVIAKTAFGLDVSCIENKDEEFYEHGRNLLYIRDGIAFVILNQFMRLIPYLQEVCVKVFKLQIWDRINLKSNSYFDTVLKATIKARRRQNKSNVRKSRTDFLDLLLKASEDASSGNIEKSDDEIIAPNVETSKTSLKPLTEEEILGQSMLVIFAGLETTATTLQMCLYELALNKGIQDKVFDEIQTFVTSETPSSEELNKLTYTEQVINETLRMYPPLPSINRVAKETRTYNGITVPKGAVIMIPIFYLHKDPRNFPDPERFDPERFSAAEKEKRDPLAFIPFGQGPRICVGMRLAYLELKVALVRILSKVEVLLTDKSSPKKGDEKVKITTRELLKPATPILLACKPRSVNNIM